MSAQIERPSFFEGQILGATDLDAGVEHARGQLARHERYLHLWGIAEGLELEGVDKKTATGTPYQEITLKAGIAIDSSGREVLVAQDTRLPVEEFEQSNRAVGQPVETWFPVFLKGLDVVPPAPLLAVGACGSNQPSRKVEGFAFEFGGPGDEVLTQDAPAIGAGPSSGLETPSRRVLLGFVQWGGAKIGQFTAVKQAHNGVGRRYAGIRADVVAARGGSLTLRTRAEVEAGKPAIVLDETDNALLQFGLLDAAGSVTRSLFSVDAKGNLTVEGQVKAAATAGSVQVQSGIAMDGAVLPLPPGITQEQVDDGKVLVHIHATLRIPSSPPPNSTDTWGAFPLECSVDADRRAQCTVRWFKLAGVGLVSIQDRPAACDYTVIVSAGAS